MAQVPRPKLGRHLVSVYIYGQAVANNGVLSDDGSPWIIATPPPDPRNVTTGVSLSESPEVVEINAANTTQRNEVITSDGWDLSLSIYQVNNTNDPNPFLTMVAYYDYFRVVWTEGTVPGSIRQFVFYGRRGQPTNPTEGRGEQLATFNLGPVDVGHPTVPQLSWTLS